MAGELISIRIVLVSGSADVQAMFRQAAASMPVPIDIVVAGDTHTALRALARQGDFLCIDGALPVSEVNTIVAAARAAAFRPFTILLAGPDPVAEFQTDALAIAPARADVAARCLRRWIQVRLPSRVLVVDDSSTMRAIVRKILLATRFPFELAEAEDGFSALRMASATHFDIVFLDYHLPEFSGLETLAEFKRENRRMSVVVMTTTQTNDIVERVRALGAAFLKKPFFPADIEALLCQHYGLRALNSNRA